MSETFTSAAIVGASGAAGVHLAAALRGGGASVRAIARRGAMLERLFPDPAIEKVAADALDAAGIARAVEGCDLVVDCIGLPASEMAHHAPAARNIAAALRSTGARGLHVSSFWAYLPIRRLPLDETHPRQGGNAYIEARRAAEDILGAAGAAVVNLPDFFGPQVQASVLQQPLAEAARGKAMNWIGGPRVAREHIYIPDAMRLVAALAQRPEAYGSRWVFPSAGPLTGEDAAAIASRHLARPVKLRAAGPLMLRLASLLVRELRDFMPMVPHYVQAMRYDSGKLERLLGPARLTPYAEAIPATLDWLRARPG